MKNVNADTFSLDIFEGPLTFLLHLIQKSEIDICDVPIQELTTQYLQKIKEIMTPSVDTGAEFIGITAMLLWMKSKMLLPKHEQPLLEDEDLDPSFEIIYKLLEYCRFKEAAKVLTQKEHEQSVFHTRGIHSIPEPEKMLGIEHLTVEDLAELFKGVVSRSAGKKRKIHEELWKVSDKIAHLRETLITERKIAFNRFFSSDKPKVELIVTFLAVLELMKIGEIIVGRETDTEKVYIFATEGTV
jgi:segregation and condensation protein A